MSKKYILFDLDGTITDSREGITKCVQYALDSFGIHEPDLGKLEKYIGPPLDESFRTFHNLSGNDITKAIEKYRERFSSIGIFENKVIDGMHDCLKELKAHDKVIALATCKPEPFSVRIIEHFGLQPYFDEVVGSTLDGSRKYKSQVIDEVFTRLISDNIGNCSEGRKLDVNSSGYAELLCNIKADAVMVGDRLQDVEGAKECMIESVGVRFGFAENGELEEAGADYIVETPKELKDFLLAL